MMGRGWSLQVPHQSCKTMQWPRELHKAWGPQLFYDTPQEFRATPCTLSRMGSLRY